MKKFGLNLVSVYLFDVSSQMLDFVKLFLG